MVRTSEVSLWTSDLILVDVASGRETVRYPLGITRDIWIDRREVAVRTAHGPIRVTTFDGKKVTLPWTGEVSSFLRVGDDRAGEYLVFPPSASRLEPRAFDAATGAPKHEPWLLDGTFWTATAQGEVVTKRRGPDGSSTVFDVYGVNGARRASRVLETRGAGERVSTKSLPGGDVIALYLSEGGWQLVRAGDDSHVRTKPTSLWAKPELLHVSDDEIIVYSLSCLDAGDRHPGRLLLFDRTLALRATIKVPAWHFHVVERTTTTLRLLADGMELVCKDGPGIGGGFHRPPEVAPTLVAIDAPRPAP
jgi:hypothetical protein